MHNASNEPTEHAEPTETTKPSFLNTPVEYERYDILEAINRLVRTTRRHIRRTWRRLPPFFSIAKHACLFLGIAAFIYGCWLIYHPGGFIVGGIILVILAHGIDEEQKSSTQQPRENGPGVMGLDEEDD